MIQTNRRSFFFLRLPALAALLLLLLTAAGSAEEPAEKEEIFSSGYYHYRILEDGTAEITSYWGDAGVLSIPEELDGLTVTALAEGAFIGPNDLLIVTIPATVSRIPANPFLYCKNLRSIRLAQDHPYLEVVDNALFSKADRRLICCPAGLKPTEYTVPDGTRVIGSRPFNSCDDLAAVLLPDSVTVIESHAFSSLPIREISLPAGLTYIGENAFYACGKLQSIVIPEGITRIMKGTFYSCSSLASVTLPDSVTVLEDEAFCRCVKLPVTSVHISHAVEYAGADLFGSHALKIPEESSVLLPESFDGAVSVTDMDPDFLAGKKILPVESSNLGNYLVPEIYFVLSPSLRTDDPGEADYMLIRDISYKARKDYSGPANNTITGLYLYGRDGSLILLCSITNYPPGAGYVKSGQSLNGKTATYQELWEKAKVYFD